MAPGLPRSEAQAAEETPPAALPPSPADPPFVPAEPPVLSAPPPAFGTPPASSRPPSSPSPALPAAATAVAPPPPGLPPLLCAGFPTLPDSGPEQAPRLTTPSTAAARGMRKRMWGQCRYRLGFVIRSGGSLRFFSKLERWGAGAAVAACR